MPPPGKFEDLGKKADEALAALGTAGSGATTFDANKQLDRATSLLSSAVAISWSIYAIFAGANAILLVAVFANGSMAGAPVGIIISSVGIGMTLGGGLIQWRLRTRIAFYRGRQEELEKESGVPPHLTAKMSENGIKGGVVMGGMGVVAILAWGAFLGYFIVQAAVGGDCPQHRRFSPERHSCMVREEMPRGGMFRERMPQRFEMRPGAMAPAPLGPREFAPNMRPYRGGARGQPMLPPTGGAGPGPVDGGMMGRPYQQMPRNQPPPQMPPGPGQPGAKPPPR